MIVRYSHYKIYDENNEVIRLVKTKHEAESITKTYTNWSYKYVPPKVIKANLPDAPF